MYIYIDNIIIIKIKIMDGNSVNLNDIKYIL